MNGPGLTSAGVWRKPCSNYPHEGLLPLDSCGFFTAADECALRLTTGSPVSGLECLSVQARQTLLQGWEAIPFDWYKDKLHRHIYRHPEGRAEVLEPITSCKCRCCAVSGSGEYGS
jgi:hypothetical protein